MRFRDGDADRLQLAAVPAKLSGARIFCESVEDMARKEFGRGVDSFEVRNVVEIFVIERLQDRFQISRSDLA